MSRDKNIFLIFLFLLSIVPSISFAETKSADKESLEKVKEYLIDRIIYLDRERVRKDTDIKKLVEANRVEASKVTNEDLKYIAKLKNITELDFSGKGLTDLSPLEKLTKLTFC